MPRWTRVIRGMIGTGVTFAAGVGVIGSIIGLAALLMGEVTAGEMLGMVGKTSVVAGIVGVAFSGVVALTARGRTFAKLSLGMFSSLGAGVGLLYFLFIAANNGHNVWSASDAIANFVILVLVGGGLAAGSLIVARKATHVLGRGEEPPVLNEGGIDESRPLREAGEELRR
jgi:hypothetical protein